MTPVSQKFVVIEIDRVKHFFDDICTLFSKSTKRIIG